MAFILIFFAVMLTHGPSHPYQAGEKVIGVYAGNELVIEAEAKLMGILFDLLFQAQEQLVGSLLDRSNVPSRKSFRA